MSSLKSLFDEYKKINIISSDDDDHKSISEYVYSTNALEGNNLTLVQTTELLNNDTVSGERVKLRDILEHRGMYKALKRVLRAVNNKEELTLGLMKELNWLVIGSYYKDDSAYLSWKSKTQKEGEFKCAENLIQVTTPYGKKIEIIPYSSSQNVEDNMKTVLRQVNFSTRDSIDKSAFLAQEIWLHQPFIDGNKRTGRLLINFLTMKEGYPLFSFKDNSQNYNSLLISQYLDKKPGLVTTYIKNELKSELKRQITKKNNAKRPGFGFRMVL